MQRKIRSAGFIICIFVRGPEEQSSGIFRRFLRLDSKKDLTLDTLFHTIQIQEAFQIHQKNQTCSVPPSSKPLALCLWLAIMPGTLSIGMPLPVALPGSGTLQCILCLALLAAQWSCALPSWFTSPPPLLMFVSTRQSVRASCGWIRAVKSWKPLPQGKHFAGMW
ncbi:hypothetical protein Naga_100283g2 [Nannochloropsis gaditana]|uniref:Uncharacterized protein n=1 Tax=Nannochloropsis gaditana TaxID=72520 RepID=W7TUU2_9STRA|nr:hypothetical protein Naga_100283g2 [Nannochloropsis gaditana]